LFLAIRPFPPLPRPTMYPLLYHARKLKLRGYKGMKRTEIKRRPLADTVLATLEPDTNEYPEHDGK